MSNLWRKTVDFVNQHKLFSMFFLAAIVLNFVIIGFSTREANESFTCSTYDRGPLGTYALYTYLADNGVNVARLKLAPYEEIYKKPGAGQTLIMLSPLLRPGAWEWNQLMAWVEAGNRLITAGVFMPTQFFAGKFEVTAWQRLSRRQPLRVTLPVDSVFPYDTVLPPLTSPTELLFKSVGKIDTAKTFVAVLSKLKPTMLPLLTGDTLVTAAKRLVGKGEWIMFAHSNPFANQVLKNNQWFSFVCRLLTGDAKYGAGRVIFDEYHNGYRATESLWAMLKYYQFNKPIIFGAILILLYLFFTGIRILPPMGRQAAPSRDIVPGLRSVAGLFIRYDSLGGLMKRELRLLSKYLLGFADYDDSGPRRLAESYCERKVLPKGLPDANALIGILRLAQSPAASMSKQELITIFNTLVLMRKELML